MTKRSFESQQARTQVINYFKYFDRKLTGSLTREQFRVLFLDLQHHDHTLSEADVDEVLSSLDTDGDGSLSLEEFLAWLSGQNMIQ